MGAQKQLKQTHHESSTNSELEYRKHKKPKYFAISESHIKIYVWELPVRIFHWLNAAAIMFLMITGFYIGKPFVGAAVQEEAYYSFLMGWGRYIHFLAAFIFIANMVFRLYWFFRGNKYSGSNLFRIIFWKEVWVMLKYYLFVTKEKPHYAGHNPLAQLSYWIFVGLGSVIAVLTGLYLYFEPQPESFLGGIFMGIAFLIGEDSFTIRSLHHLLLWSFMLFIVIHIYMSFRDDYLQRNGTMSSIFTGYKTEPKEVLGEQDDKK